MLGFALEEHRWVCLTEEEKRQDSKNSLDNSEDPEYPAPALCSYEVTPCYGSDDRA